MEHRIEARIVAIALASLALALAGACSKPAEQQAKEDAAKQLQDAGKQMEQAAKEVETAAKKGGEGMAEAMGRMGMAVGGAVTGAAKSMGTAVEPVDFRELKNLLPDGIGAMKRTAAEGEKAGGFGFVVSHAEARYEGGGGRATLKITDPGSLSGMAAMAAMWMNLELDKESETGYEKTGTANGRRFHEKYDKSSKSGEYTVIVANRFIVEVDGHGIDMPTMKKALEQINLAKLESMKDVGVAK
jgi:hypothetical protein